MPFVRLHLECRIKLCEIQHIIESRLFRALSFSCAANPHMMYCNLYIYLTLPLPRALSGGKTVNCLHSCCFVSRISWLKLSIPLEGIVLLDRTVHTSCRSPIPKNEQIVDNFRSPGTDSTHLHLATPPARHWRDRRCVVLQRLMQLGIRKVDDFHSLCSSNACEPLAFRQSRHRGVFLHLSETQPRRTQTT